MNLDLPTLLLVLTLTTLGLAAAVLFVGWGAAGRDGLREWGLGLLIHALVYPAFALRLVEGGMSLSLVASNGLLAATLSVQLLGLMRFQGAWPRRGATGLLWGPVLAALLLGWLLPEAHRARLLGLNAVLALQGGLLAWQAWEGGRPRKHERGRLLLVVGSGVLVGIGLWRGIACLGAADWDGRLGLPPAVATLTYLLASITLMLNTMGFVLMQKERAILEQHEQAIRDPLTGIANRRALDETLAREAARAARAQQPLALLMIDIDWFKKVNDSHGHQVGDVVLRALAGRLQERLRRQDLLARFGGEEFVVLLPDTGVDGASAVAEDLRVAVAAAPFVVAGRPIAITVSVGVAAGVPAQEALAQARREGGGDAGSTVAALLVASDQALYRAKQEGRNRVCVAAAD